MDIHKANQLLGSIRNLNEQQNYLEEMYKEVLQSIEIVTFVPYGNPFGHTVKVPVPTEGVAAAVARDLAVVKEQIKLLAEEARESLGV